MECNVVTTPIGEHNPAIDYFDPVGVGELRRTLSHYNGQTHHSGQPPLIRTSTQPSRPASEVISPERGINEPAASIGGSDDTTVAPADGEGDPGFDFEQSLRDYIVRRDEAGIEPRKLGVLFDDLTVVGLGASARHQPTLGSLFNPFDIIQSIQAKRHPPLRNIISGFEGVVRPGEMLLVLGRPGAGCSTLLKTLTNQTSGFHSVSGDIAFSSLTPSLLASRFRGDVQYTPEDDLHFPTLTVEETVRFAARCRAPATAARVRNAATQDQAKEGGPDSVQTRDEYEKRLTDIFLTLFGLRHVRDSVVGNEKLRGVSGGEKKRVSIAEAMAARALVAAWDNSTRGLDSSTALSFLMALRLATTHLQRTTMVCLYQASDAMYALFDKVCVIYEGRMIYFGPASEAKAYFEDMGWEARNRQSTPDFLVSVTDAEARVWRGNSDREDDEVDGQQRGSGDGGDSTSRPCHSEQAPLSEPSIMETPRTPTEDANTGTSISKQMMKKRRISVRAAISEIQPPAPRMPAEFAAHFFMSDISKRNREDMHAFRRECGLAPKERRSVELAEADNSQDDNASPTNDGGIDTSVAGPSQQTAPRAGVAPLLRVQDPFSTNASTYLTSTFGRSISRYTSRFSSNSRRQTADELPTNNVHHPPGSKHPQTQAYKKSVAAEHAKRARTGSPYVISIPMQLRAVMRRRVKIVQGDWLTQALSTGTFVIQAVIIGTVFVNIADATSAYFSRGGVLFFALFLPALFTMSEIPSLFAQRPIVRRHERAAMYHPMIEALAMTLVDVPVTFITISIYSIVLYFVVRLQRSAGQFFIFFLFVFTTSLSMKAFFRALAAAFPVEAPAQALAGVMLLALSLYTGYQIPIPSMIGALKWISYINPIRYAFEGVMVNEFHTLDGQCSKLVPSGSGYEGITLNNQVCTTVGSIAGQSTVDGNRFVAQSFKYSYGHLWRNFGILLAFGMGFTLCLLVFTEIQTTTARADNDIVLFKRGSKAAVLQEAEAAVGEDEEKDAPPAGVSSPRPANGPEHHDREEEKKALAADQPRMTDVFSWSRIKYTIPISRGENRVLLDDVSGYVAPGKLTALMGASGAGKTTLLNVLAERVGTGVVTGDRYVNGQSLPGDFQAQTGYCQQMDTHVPTTTVREALRFSARLRQPASVSTAEKDEYAEKCLKMCGLEDFADATVGTLGVEHKKRTTIGVELAAKPQLLLFLDEPTSGLDSQSAWGIVSFLRDLADNGQAILCTIHQPSAELFQVFDRLLLLRPGGQTVYFGDLGHNSATLIDYFESNGARQCKPGENPAEYMLEVIGAGATAVADRDWHQVWIKTGGEQRLQADIEKIHAQGRQQSPVKASMASQFATSFAYQLKELTWRQYASYWRNPAYPMSKLSLNIIGGLFIGFTFFKSGDTVQDTQNKLFSIFMATILSAPLAGQMHVPYINLRDIYEVRESSSRMYSWAALVTAQMLVEIPWNILGSTLFFLCWYWTVGFATSRAGYTYLMLGLLFPTYFTTIALAIASMAPTAEIAGLLFSFLFSFVLTFNGVLQPYSQLGWWKWMYRLSPYTYLIEGLLGQAIGHQQVVCSSTELVTVNPPSGNTCSQFFQNYISNQGGYVNNPDATSACQFCSTRTTDEFFGPTFNISYEHHWRDLGIFCAFIAFNTFAVYIFTYLFRIRSGNIVASIKKIYYIGPTVHNRSCKSRAD